MATISRPDAVCLRDKTAILRPAAVSQWTLDSAYSRHPIYLLDLWTRCPTNRRPTQMEMRKIVPFSPPPLHVQSLATNGRELERRQANVNYFRRWHYVPKQCRSDNAFVPAKSMALWWLMSTTAPRSRCMFSMPLISYVTPNARNISRHPHAGHLK